MNAVYRNSSLSSSVNTEYREGVGAFTPARARAPGPRPSAGPDGHARSLLPWAALGRRGKFGCHRPVLNSRTISNLVLS
jgi:hypothetical protein